MGILSSLAIVLLISNGLIVAGASPQAFPFTFEESNPDISLLPSSVPLDHENPMALFEPYALSRVSNGSEYYVGVQAFYSFFAQRGNVTLYLLYELPDNSPPIAPQNYDSFSFLFGDYYVNYYMPRSLRGCWLTHAAYVDGNLVISERIRAGGNLGIYGLNNIGSTVDPLATFDGTLAALYGPGYLYPGPFERLVYNSCRFDFYISSMSTSSPDPPVLSYEGLIFERAFQNRDTVLEAYRNYLGSYYGFGAYTSWLASVIASAGGGGGGGDITDAGLASEMSSINSQHDAVKSSAQSGFDALATFDGSGNVPSTIGSYWSRLNIPLWLSGLVITSLVVLIIMRFMR